MEKMFICIQIKQYCFSCIWIRSCNGKKNQFSAELWWTYEVNEYHRNQFLLSKYKLTINLNYVIHCLWQTLNQDCSILLKTLPGWPDCNSSLCHVKTSDGLKNWNAFKYWVYEYSVEMLPSGLETLKESTSAWHDRSFQKAATKSLVLSEATPINLCFNMRHPGDTAITDYWDSWKLFALLRYWKCTGSFKKYSISAYHFSNISGHIVELQFSIPGSRSIKPWKCLLTYTPLLHLQK